MLATRMLPAAFAGLAGLATLAPAAALAQSAEPLPPPPVYADPAQPVYSPPAAGPPVYGSPPASGAPVYGQPAYGQPAYAQPSYSQPVPRWRRPFQRQLGLGVRATGQWADNGLLEYGLGGLQGDLLLRASPHVTTELSSGYLRTGLAGYDRTDVPITLGVRLHLGGPRSVVSPYFVVAGGAQYARLDSPEAGGYEQAWFLQGQLGGGLEVRLGRHFALNADLRGIGHLRVDQGARLVALDVFGQERPLLGSQLGLQGNLGLAAYF